MSGNIGAIQTAGMVFCHGRLNKNDPQEQPVIGNTERDDLRRAGCPGCWGIKRNAKGAEDALRDLTVRVAAGQ